MNRHKLLVVDSVEVNRKTLREIFEEEYQILEADSTALALQILEKSTDEIAIVLLDWNLSGNDGSRVLTEMKKKEWLNKIPVLIVTEECSIEKEREYIGLGASDLIRRPFDREVIKRRVAGSVELYHHKNYMEEKIREQNQLVRKQYIVLKMQAEKLKDANQKMIDVIGNIIEYHDPESHANLHAIREMSRIIGQKVQKYYPEYNLTDKDVETISELSSLRDIGKLLISDHILFKPAKLTKEEAEYMKSHTTKGCEIVKLLEEIQPKDYQKKSVEICRYHHERYDGKGYPEGLKGDEIPISAQIVSIVDAYHALISERVYKRAYPKEEAYFMILRGECGQFSPKLLECFRMSKKEIEEIEN